jgi:putative transposase
MPLDQLFYHLVWSTKRRLPIISAELEACLFSAIRRKASGLGIQVFALNGWIDRLHLVASIPANLSVADAVGAMKGYLSFYLNYRGCSGSFYWQEEYGAFSLDRISRLKSLRYVEKKNTILRKPDLSGNGNM